MIYVGIYYTSYHNRNILWIMKAAQTFDECGEGGCGGSKWQIRVFPIPIYPGIEGGLPSFSRLSDLNFAVREDRETKAYKGNVFTYHTINPYA